MSLTARQILDYEVRASWWASFISWGWAQSISGKWFGWKVNRKFARYSRSLTELTQALAALDALRASSAAANRPPEPRLPDDKNQGPAVSANDLTEPV